MKKEIFEINVGMPFDINQSTRMPKDFKFILIDSSKKINFLANLSILKSSSKLIESQNPENGEYTIEQGKVSIDEVKLFLRFSYGFEISINYQTLDNIKRIATYFNSPILLEKSFAFSKCLKAFEKTISMVNDQTNGEKYLKLIAQHFYLFRISHFLSKLETSLIFRILLMPNLCDNSEESICLFVIENLSLINENQQFFNELLSTIRSELFSDSFCQFLIENFGSNKSFILPLIQRKLTYEKEHDSLANRTYQKNDIETCINLFLQDSMSIA